MLLKWIQCTVAESMRDAFSVAQARWRVLADVPGLVAQVGGWDQAGSGPDTACILALWESPRAYEEFMREHHDRMAAVTGQSETCGSCVVALFETTLAMPGSSASLGAALASTGFLRVADCTVRSDRQVRFQDMQRAIWAPGMLEAGMLAGEFARALDGSTRYLVATAWQDAAAHDAYLRGSFAALRRAARVEEDVERLESRQVRLEAEWSVRPTV